MSTGAPPTWGMVRYMVCGLVGGAAFTGLLPDFRATLLGALAGVVVAASGSAGPSGISRRVALVSAGVGFVLMAVAFATGNDPVWAALAVAPVALLTSLAAAAGPLGALLGFLVSLAYFLIATMARRTAARSFGGSPWSGGTLEAFDPSLDEIQAAHVSRPSRWAPVVAISSTVMTALLPSFLRMDLKDAAEP